MNRIVCTAYRWTLCPSVEQILKKIKTLCEIEKVT